MRLAGLLTGLVLATLAPGGAAADHLITFELAPPFLDGEEPGPKERYTIWLGESRLREDRKDQSVIVDHTSSKLYVIKHADKVYHVLDLPLDFESMVPADQKEAWRAMLQERKTSVKIGAAGESETLGKYSVKKYDAVLENAMGATLNLTLWNSENVEFDGDACKRMVLDIAALQPGADGWIRDLFALDGYPVRMVRTYESAGGKLVSTEEIVSVREQEAPAGTWLPEPGYTAVELDLQIVPR